MEEIIKCPITELKAVRLDATSYRIETNGEYLFVKHGLRFDALLDHEDFKKNKHIFAGAILNKQLSDRGNQDVYWFSLTLDDYKEKLSNIIYPKSPKEKLDNLFKSIFDLQKFDGQDIEIIKHFEEPGFSYRHFFKSPHECAFYIRLLQRNDLIENLTEDKKSNLGPVLTQSCKLTYKGLNYYL